MDCSESNTGHPAPPAWPTPPKNPSFDGTGFDRSSWGTDGTPRNPRATEVAGEVAGSISTQQTDAKWRTSREADLGLCAHAQNLEESQNGSPSAPRQKSGRSLQTDWPTALGGRSTWGGLLRPASRTAAARATGWGASRRGAPRGQHPTIEHTLTRLSRIRVRSQDRVHVN